MKLIFLALLLVVYSQARITIPLEKVRIDDPGSSIFEILSSSLLESAGLGDASVVSTSARFLAQSDDSLKVNFWNQRNVRFLKRYETNSSHSSFILEMYLLDLRIRQ